MTYMLMAYVNEAGWHTLTKAQQEQGMAAYVAYVEALTHAGAFKSSNSLGLSSSATTVRIENGRSRVLDGP